MSPRGNDSEAAGRELSAKLGVELNAETHIERDSAKWPAALRTASKLKLSEEATEAFGEDRVQEVVGDREVLSYAIHGGRYLVVVSADKAGETLKQAFTLADLDGGAQKPARAGSGGRR